MDSKTKNTLVVSLSISVGILGGLFLMYKIHTKRLAIAFNKQLDDIDKQYNLKEKENTFAN